MINESVSRGFTFGTNVAQNSVNPFTFGTTTFTSSVKPEINTSFKPFDFNCYKSPQNSVFDMGSFSKKETTKRRKYFVKEDYIKVEHKYITDAYKKFKLSEQELMNEIYQYNIDNPKKTIDLKMVLKLRLRSIPSYINSKPVLRINKNASVD